jgi:DNA-binding MarR family transcriptional regulator
MTAALGKVKCACTSLHRAARVVGRAYDEALASSGLNATQYAILVNVERYQPVSQMDLARHLELERTTLYRAAAILERHGWLHAVETGEGVAKALTLTRAGARRVAAAKHEWEKIQDGFIEAFGASEWDKFLSTLDKLRGHFSADQS